jgi:hypothetical protein
VEVGVFEKYLKKAGGGMDALPPSRGKFPKN